MKQIALFLGVSLIVGFSAARAEVSFGSDISPILKAKCSQCHGGLIPQGGLKLNSLKNLKKGGKSGKVVVPGNAESSLMVRQFYLPKTDPKRMPPMGAPELTESEIGMIRAWIDAGAK
ncbi:MAG: c-type cytochrome domain-containing protein [Verrucomicrobiota bacterium]